MPAFSAALHKIGHANRVSLTDAFRPTSALRTGFTSRAAFKVQPSFSLSSWVADGLSQRSDVGLGKAESGCLPDIRTSAAKHVRSHSKGMRSFAPYAPFRLDR